MPTEAPPGARSGRYDRSLDDCLVVLQLAWQDVEVNYPAGWLVDDVDDLGDGWRILVTSDDDGAGPRRCGSGWPSPGAW
jgi:hypothetical protein